MDFEIFHKQEKTIYKMTLQKIKSISYLHIFLYVWKEFQIMKIPGTHS